MFMQIETVPVATVPRGPGAHEATAANAFLVPTLVPCPDPKRVLAGLARPLHKCVKACEVLRTEWTMMTLG